MNIHSRKSVIIVFLFPLFIIAVLFALRSINETFYFQLIQENSPAENLQFVFYVYAGVLAFKTMYQFRQKNIEKSFIFIYGLFAISLFLVAFEEISWGQHILQFGTPEVIEEINTQDEFTFHNLELVQSLLHLAYMLVGLYGAIAWLIATKFFKKIFGDNYVYLVPSKKLTLYFFTVLLFYFFLDFIRPEIFAQTATYILDPRDQEIFETILSIGFLIFSYENFRISTKRVD